jgi:lysophospholipase L1-like esterase
VAIVVFLTASGSPQSHPTPVSSPLPSIEQLPETDDGLPGAGPIRRYEEFRALWQARHALWSARVKKDQGAVVFVGDSITQDWGDDMGGNFPGVKVANRGISGDTTRGVLIRIQEDVLALHPRAVVILAGTNDLEEEADPETIAGNMALILEALRARGRDMPILLCEVFPSSAAQKRSRERITKVNQLYASLVKGNPQVTLLDTWNLFADETGNAKPSEFPDLLHPNKLGYAKWASILVPALTACLAPRSR